MEDRHHSMEEVYILVDGNAVEGFTFTGPFVGEDVALEYGATRCPDAIAAPLTPLDPSAGLGNFVMNARDVLNEYDPNDQTSGVRLASVLADLLDAIDGKIDEFTLGEA